MHALELPLGGGAEQSVVGLLSEDAFEVEFCDESGHTYGLHTFRAVIQTVLSVQVSQTDIPVCFHKMNRQECLYHLLLNITCKWYYLRITQQDRVDDQLLMQQHH